MSFLGFLTFNAPYLPWTLIGFSLVLHSVLPYADVLGLIVGHTYYFLQDVFPNMPVSGGRRLLKTPAWLVNAIQGQARIAPIQDLHLPNNDAVPLQPNNQDN